MKTSLIGARVTLTFLCVVVAKATELGIDQSAIAALSPADFIKDLERKLIFAMQPPWNSTGKRHRPFTPLRYAACYWIESRIEATS